eukprot:COSAG05_NODE_19940_length_285_cov_1.010753_1_plen_47_part_10
MQRSRQDAKVGRQSCARLVHTMLGGTIHDTEACPPPTAHEVNDTERR